MGTQMTNKERYLQLWERLEQGIKKIYGGSLRKFARDYFDRAPDNEYAWDYELKRDSKDQRNDEDQFIAFYEHLKKLHQRKNSFDTVTSTIIEKMEKYYLFLEKEKLYFHSMLDDEYILTD